MQRGFTKLFNTIVTSTIWSEDDKTRIMWITMLAIADQDGIVSASIPGLAKVANISIQDAEKSLENLKAPDEYSRTKDFEGRRIEEVDGGWMVLNYVKYRRMLSEEERREYKAKWIKQKRRQMSTVSTEVDGGRPESTNASASYSVFVQQLKKDSTYKGINVEREFGKMLNWCKVRRFTPTKRRFVNWLNNIDKPIEPDRPVKLAAGLDPTRPTREPSEDELTKQRQIIREAKAELKL